MDGIVYYLARNGEILGSYNESVIQNMRIDGALSEDMYYYIEEIGSWRSIDNLFPELDRYIEEDLERLKSGEGCYLAGLDPMRMSQFPCWELVILYERLERRDWKERWSKAGGKIYNDRMIALKTDPVWMSLGSSEIFGDGYNKPYPPFARNSGMGVEEIDRDESIKLGIITDDFDALSEEEEIRLRKEAANFTIEELDQVLTELNEEIERLDRGEKL